MICGVYICMQQGKKREWGVMWCIVCMCDKVRGGGEGDGDMWCMCVCVYVTVREKGGRMICGECEGKGG